MLLYINFLYLSLPVPWDRKCARNYLSFRFSGTHYLTVRFNNLFGRPTALGSHLVATMGMSLG